MANIPNIYLIFFITLLFVGTTLLFLTNQDVRETYTPSPIRAPTDTKSRDVRSIEELETCLYQVLTEAPPLVTERVLPYTYKSPNYLPSDGLLLEFGVYGGASINHAATLAPNRTIYGFDTFEGLPSDWRKGYLKGMFSLKGKLPKVRENVRLYQGLLPESLIPLLKERNETVALAHMDLDLYTSTFNTLVTLAIHNRIVPGTMLVFDELINYPGWREGEWRALLEAATLFGWQVEVLATRRGLEAGTKRDLDGQDVAIRIRRVGWYDFIVTNHTIC